MVTFEEHNAAYKSVMKHIINTRDGANITVFYAQPKFSEYMLLSVDSRLRCYIREVQKRKRPFNPEEIRLLWDGKTIDNLNTKKTGGAQPKGQSKKPHDQIAYNNAQFPGLNEQFDEELDNILVETDNINAQNYKVHTKKASESSKTFVSQKNRRKSSKSSNSKKSSDGSFHNCPENKIMNQKLTDQINPKLDLQNQNFEKSDADTDELSSNNRSQSEPLMNKSANLYQISEDLFENRSVDDTITFGNYQQKTDYNESVNVQEKCKKQLYTKPMKLQKQSYMHQMDGNQDQFCWDNNQQYMQDNQYNNFDQNDYVQNGAYQKMYAQSYMFTSNAQYNNEHYSGQQTNQNAENFYAQANHYSQNQVSWDSTYYSSQQEHYNCYQGAQENYGYSYDYQSYNQNTAYNDYYQNSNFNYNYPSTEAGTQDNMYQWKNHSNNQNNMNDFKQGNQESESFYYNVDHYQQNITNQNQKDFSHQSQESNKYFSHAQEYDLEFKN
jgi:hypothetical protein